MPFKSPFRAPILLLMVLMCSMNMTASQEGPNRKKGKCTHWIRSPWAMLLGAGATVAFLAKYGWPFGVPGTRVPTAAEHKDEGKQVVLPHAVQYSTLLDLLKQQSLPSNAISLAQSLRTDHTTHSSLLIAAVSLYSRDEKMMTWLQSTVDIDNKDGGYTALDRLMYTPLHELSGEMVHEDRNPAITFLCKYGKPNPFVTHKQTGKPYASAADICIASPPHTFINSSTADMVYNYASDYVLGNYHDYKELLRQHTPLPDVLSDIITGYIDSKPCEPAAMRHITHVVSNDHNNEEALLLKKALLSSAMLYKDSEQHNALWYIDQVVPCGSQADVIDTLLNAGVDYFDYLEHHPKKQLDYSMDRVIAHYVKKFTAEHGWNPQYFHRPFLYTVLQASVPSYDQKDLKKQEWYFRRLKEFVSTNNEILKVHDNNNQSIWDYTLGNEEVIDYFVLNGADPNMYDTWHNTIFHRTALPSSLPFYCKNTLSDQSDIHPAHQTALFLLEKYPEKIDMRAKNKFGQTAVQMWNMLESKYPKKYAQMPKQHVPQIRVELGKRLLQQCVPRRKVHSPTTQPVLPQNQKPTKEEGDALD